MKELFLYSQKYKELREKYKKVFSLYLTEFLFMKKYNEKINQKIINKDFEKIRNIEDLNNFYKETGINIKYNEFNKKFKILYYACFFEEKENNLYLSFGFKEKLDEILNINIEKEKIKYF